MKRDTKLNLIIGLMVIAIVASLAVKYRNNLQEVFGLGGVEGTSKYIASAGDDQVIIANDAILHRVIIGKDVGGGAIKIADHASRTVGVDPLFYVTGSTLSGVWDVGAIAFKGLVATVTNQTDIIVIYSPK